MNCVILADGLFPTGNTALAALRNADYICCCDGAVEKLLTHGFLPDAIVGDGDSVSEPTKKRFSDIFIKMEEQETNDLTKATLHCIQRGFRKITYLGATGLREDHTVANIFLLPYYFEKFGIEPTMLTDHGVFSVHRGSGSFTSRPGQQVSIFNINCQTLQADGLKWPTYPFAQLWQGSLNEALASTFTLTADGLYLLYLAE